MVHLEKRIALVADSKSLKRFFTHFFIHKVYNMVAPGHGSPNGQHEATGACGAFRGGLDQQHDIDAKLSQYIQSTGHWQASLERELGLEGGLGPHPAVLRTLVSSSLQQFDFIGQFTVSKRARCVRSQ